MNKFRATTDKAATIYTQLQSIKEKNKTSVMLTVGNGNSYLTNVERSDAE